MKKLSLILIVALLSGSAFANSVELETVSGDKVDVEMNKLVDGLKAYVSANNDLYEAMEINSDGTVSIIEPRFMMLGKVFKFAPRAESGYRANVCAAFGFEKTVFLDLEKEISEDERLVRLTLVGGDFQEFVDLDSFENLMYKEEALKDHYRAVVAAICK